MLNITYYLGAGASFSSLPLYSNFQTRLSLFRDYIFFYQEKLNDNTKKQLSLHYIDKLTTLIDLLDPNDFDSLDILAHDLYVKQNTNEESLKFFQLKYLISDFFIFEQLKKNQRIYYTQQNDISSATDFEAYDKTICERVNNSIDKRYSPFFLPNLQTDARKFKPEINFISWNYDLQMELAYAKTYNVSLLLAQQQLQVYPSPSLRDLPKSDASAIIKLNGTAGIFYADSNNEKLQNFIYEKEFDWHEEYLETMIKVFYANSGRIFGGNPFFKFYFEENRNSNNKALEYANAIMKKTDILVVIGYSFHTSNREIDEAVFKNCSQIKKVIFQTADNDYPRVKHNFLNIKPELENKMSLYPDINNFPTPNNLGSIAEVIT